MRGVQSADLIAIVDFLYCGETNIPKDNLDSFLNIAEELNLRGLAGGTEQKEAKPATNTHKTKTLSNIRKQIKDETFQREDHSDTYNPEEDETEIKTPLASNISFNGELHELDAKIKTMMVRGQNLTTDGKKTATVCQFCGK